MRILLALGGSTLSTNPDDTVSNQRRRVEAAAEVLAEIVADHEVIVTHGYGRSIGHALELSLRNALPERDVVTVLTQVVVAPDASSLEPHAIAEIRSLRCLLDCGSLIICASGDGVPIALDGLGTMHEIAARIDPDLTAALLARRLDADLLMMLTDPLQDAATREAKAAAARRFVEATGRRGAVGSIADMAQLARSDTLAA